MRHGVPMLFSAIAALALGATLFAGSAEAQIRPDACVRELARSTMEGIDPTDYSAQYQIADVCRRVSATARGVEAARARFYAGRAFVRAGNVDEAIRQLEIAVNAGLDFEPQFRRELRAARLSLVQAYRAKGRIEAARNLLNDPALRPSDPAVAHQRALLALAELGEAGEAGAFDALKTVFIQDDARLRGTPDDPTQLTQADIRSGRSWLYRLGVTLGRRTLDLQAREPEQRRADAQRAIDYLRPAVDAINGGCPDPGPIDCPTGVFGTEAIGSVPSSATPTREELLNTYFQIGVAYLKAAGLQESQTGARIGEVAGIGGLGALDCIGSQLAPDAARHIQNARFAFETYIRRSSASSASSADARWGLGCTILASLPNIYDSNERQRQLAQAIAELRQAPERPATFLTLARAQVLQGQMESARASYKEALDRSGEATRCPRGQYDFPPNNRAELPSRIYLEMARTRFTDLSARDRASASGDSGDLFERTIDEVVNARPGSLREAEADLRCAIYLSHNNIEARLTLGHIYLRLGADTSAPPLDTPPYEKANQALQYFERPQADRTEGRAEGLYLLSKRLTLSQQQRQVAGQSRSSTDRAFRRDGALAVRYASQAYNLTQRAQFRQQACLGQILFGEVADQGYCVAAGSGEDRAEASLYEGLYWLRRGQRETVPERLKSWSRSIQAFNRGVSLTGSGQMVESGHPSLPATIDLRSLLTYGQRYVLRCTGLDEGDTESAANEVKSFFFLSGIPRQCGGPPS